MKSTVLSLCAALVLLLSACGVKPADVSPPQGEDKDYFPRTYPDPATDPMPYRSDLPK